MPTATKSPKKQKKPAASASEQNESLNNVASGESSGENLVSSKPKRSRKPKSEDPPRTDEMDAEDQSEEQPEVKVDVSNREIAYPDIGVGKRFGDKPITAADAKKWLGWQTESENIKFGGSFLIKDDDGNKVRCHNNVTNRPLKMLTVMTLKQEILRGKWAGPAGSGDTINGEPIIIGKTKLILNGQHTLLALILAEQEWTKHPDRYPHWADKAPVIDKLVVTGVSETDAVVNTLDTATPRTLMDVIFRSHYFADMKRKDRKALARITDYAIRILWDRTGTGLDAFAPKRTHAEALDFLARHPRLLECVKHVYEGNGKENRLQAVLSPGYASGMMYLMAASATDRDAGYTKQPAESNVDFAQWDTAAEFIVYLAQNADGFKPVRQVLAKMIEEGKPVNVRSRIAVLANAWIGHLNGGITDEIYPFYEVNAETGLPELAEDPTVGGIDVGSSK